MAKKFLLKETTKIHMNQISIESLTRKSKKAVIIYLVPVLVRAKVEGVKFWLVIIEDNGFGHLQKLYHEKTQAFYDAVLLVGGPYWDVPLGRKDSRSAGYALTDTNLPTADEGLIFIISKFISQGLSVTDMVALSGAHTIGKARCVNFKKRIYGDFLMTTSLNPISHTYLSNLKSVCPPIGTESDNNETAMDYVTPNLFDNSYYHVLLRGEGLINSDQELYSSFLGIQTKKLVEEYAVNPIAFFEQFAESMVKLGNITNLETCVNGEVRKNCRYVNT
ncbi:peroxidase 11-like [Nicotiana tabacum]|uniref:Peroxidase 11-like n=1 Tax=Nicotiana tabacum TaxID=4097 RepID=A0AC58STT8_TOBAC